MPILKVKQGGVEFLIELPQTELEVLCALSFETPFVAPQISEKTNKSAPTVYSLLWRLHKKGFVTKEIKTTNVLGSNIRRVLWQTVFMEMETVKTTTSLK